MGKSNVDALREELSKARERFSNSVEGLVAQNDPRVVKDRIFQSTKSFIQGEIDNAVSFIRNEDGTWKTDVLVRVGSVAAGTLVGFLLLRRMFKGYRENNR